MKDQTTIKNKTTLSENEKGLIELLETFYGKPIDEIFVESTQEEIDTGGPVGEEVW